MTVKELIEVLSRIQDQKTRVMVKGYEGGYNDIVIGNGIDSNTPATIDIALDVNEEWYYGAHEKVEDIDRDHLDKFHIVRAIVI